MRSGFLLIDQLIAGDFLRIERMVRRELVGSLKLGTRKAVP